MTYAVFMTLRLPRTLMAVLAGAGLSLAGYIYQLCLKIFWLLQTSSVWQAVPMPGPLLGIVVMGAGSVLVPIYAFFGGILAVLLVMLFAKQPQKFTGNHCLVRNCRQCHGRSRDYDFETAGRSKQ